MYRLTAEDGKGVALTKIVIENFRITMLLNFVQKERRMTFAHELLHNLNNDPDLLVWAITDDEIFAHYTAGCYIVSSYQILVQSTRNIILNLCAV